MEEIYYPKKNTRKNKKNKFIYKFLILVLLTLITLIGVKKNNKFKEFIYNNVYDKHFSFAKINKVYQNFFGSPIPFKDWFVDKTQKVFNEKLTYDELNIYKEGIKLSVDSNYLIPVLKDGIVVFVGDKEEYGNTVIIQQENGVDVWYSNIINLNVKLYDYVKKGSLLAEATNEEIYLVFKKDGKKVDYTSELQN